VKFAIFGSCVSRDLFEEPVLRPHLALYAARCSVISAVARPLPLDPERIVLSSAWQRRCVLADFQKTFFRDLADTRPDWLVIDLIDERFDLLRSDGSFVTRSSAYQAAGLGEQGDRQLELVRRMSEEGCALFEAAAPEFASRVLEVVPSERVVLHRALWCTHYRRDGEVLPFPDDRMELCRRQNAMLDRAYGLLEAAFGREVTTLAVDPARDLADAHHRWQLEPYHYERSYNAAAIAGLNALLSEG
jgi:hypothetical protein